jgi:hypothetical protein
MTRLLCILAYDIPGDSPKLVFLWNTGCSQLHEPDPRQEQCAKILDGPLDLRLATRTRILLTT